ncbi:MAG: hypothetical protein FD136_75 [Chitinophagaceae bacterium]|nr:MAG: hypothetical protein FD136_75 [Chitinophagaceae bacterium]
MKKYLIGIWYSLPIQLFLLHFRRYQIFLIFWYLLFSTVAGGFMKTFGAFSLFLAPEYFGEVSALSTAIVGFTSGVFIMSWNITTFILHSKQLKFLATNAQPFLKYCINNAIIPMAFLIFYLIKAINYSSIQELASTWDIVFLAGGYTGGLMLSLLIAFIYFFGADKTIYYTLATNIKTANEQYDQAITNSVLQKEKFDMRVDWFLTAGFKLRKPRDVRHYSTEFLEAIFNRHHVAAVLAIVMAFVFLVLVGYSSDTRLFQLPAAASITIFFSILIAVAGALSMFLRSWSIPLVVTLYILANYLYQQEVIDPRNKAYGLNYINKKERPLYNKEAIGELANDSAIEADKQQYLTILNNWKRRQKSDKPILYIINTSGGGTRSANFTMNTLQQIDRLMGGTLMQQTVLINGASGGMLGAAYYRELYYEKINGAKINLQDQQYVEAISKDLLSPIFSSFLTRDLVGPIQKFNSGGFEYKKDRGYAFEQKLNENTNGVLNKTIASYSNAEAKAIIPSIFFNSVITRDGRKMIIASRPVRFLMKPPTDTGNISSFDPDAIDFNSFFQKQNSTQISILSALRMNATFPYVLPNVWLPTNPIIDVMDAGLRDNYGQESALRFIEVFKDWLQQNTSKVVLIQIRDRSISDWDKPLESNSLIGFLTKPFLILQNNWFKMQDYYQHDQLSYLYQSFGKSFHRVSFQYVPSKKEAPASLSFHLTAAEKRDIANAINNPLNQQAFDRLKILMKEN